MRTPRRIVSNIPFEKIDDLGNGKYYYNFDRNSYEVETVDMDNTPVVETRYSCIQVKLNTKPTYKNCVAAILREFVSESEEFDLINSQTESDIDAQKYKDYLEKRIQIKSLIKQDFNNE